jgi:isopenicillin-N N-acyltransferase like protein
MGLTILCVLISPAAPLLAQSGAETEQRQRDAREFGVPIIEVAGDGAEIGTTYGHRLAQPMRELFSQYLMRWIDTDTKRAIAIAAARGFARHIEPHHKAEITAVAQASGFQPVEVMLAQCFLDLSPMTACSSLSLPGDAFADGVPRLARNLDFPSLNVADKHSVVLIYRPAGKHAFASVTWPGMVGVLSGMNEHGLVLVNMEVDRGGGVPRAMPYCLLYRKVLEECRTVDEAVKLLETSARQTPNNLMLMDAAGQRAVVELTPEKVTVRRGQPGQGLVSTNHHRGVDQITTGRCWRYDSLMKTAAGAYGQLDTPALQAMLKDVQQGTMTLQTMVFEPTTRTLYLATGKKAAERQMKRLELTTYFAD